MFFAKKASRAGVPKPTSPAPNNVPIYCSCMAGTGQEMIKNQLFYYTYVWMRGGPSFWMFPTSYRAGVVSGYVWNGHSWEYKRFKADLIDCIF